MGEGAAHKDHGRARKVARRGRVARMTATVTAIAAANGYHQRPVTVHNSRTTRANSAYFRPEKQTVHGRRTGQADLRFLGATLGATGANDAPRSWTDLNNGPERVRGHGLI